MKTRKGNAIGIITYVAFPWSALFWFCVLVIFGLSLLIHWH